MVLLYLLFDWDFELFKDWLLLFINWSFLVFVRFRTLGLIDFVFFLNLLNRLLFVFLFVFVFIDLFVVLELVEVMLGEMFCWVMSFILLLIKVLNVCFD